MIQQASFIDFFQVLFSILFILAIGFWITLLLAPMILRFFLKRKIDAMEKQFYRNTEPTQQNREQYYNNNSNNHQNTSTNGNGRQSKEKKVVGEYIDFEEIE